MIRRFKTYQPQIEENCFLAESCDVIGRVTLAKDANIWFGAVLRGDVDTIHIGEGSNIQDNTTVHVTSGNPVKVGDYVTVGHNCIIHGCTIEDNSLIGMGSTVLDGAVVGKNSLVGAGSLVTKNKVFPEGSLIMGRPAKVVRALTEEEIAGLKVSAEHYVENAAAYMA